MNLVEYITWIPIGKCISFGKNTKNSCYCNKVAIKNQIKNCLQICSFVEIISYARYRSDHR